MDTGIASPSNATGEGDASRSGGTSGAGGDPRATRAPGAAPRPGGPSPQHPTGQPAATGAAESGAAPKTPPLDKVQALGHALWLMTQSPVHRHMFVADMEWLLIPPVTLGQFRLWRHGNQPIGFVTWAFVNDEVDERLRRGDVKLRPLDWKCGEKAWLIDMIFPFGGSEEALRELKDQVFRERPLTSLVRAPNLRAVTL